MAWRLVTVGGLMHSSAGGAWSAPETVAGFVESAPNPVLVRFAEIELRRRSGSGRALDLGCGAAWNAVPLIELAGRRRHRSLVGMLSAAAQRARQGPLARQPHLVLAPIDHIPFPGRSFALS